jgi:hypothetical protein
MAQISPFWARMQPLGARRCRILACLGADNPKLPAFFDPPRDRPVHEYLHRHLLDLHEKWGDDPDSRRIVAAGLLSFGELTRADEILSRFPPKAIVLDHGAGWCPMVAYTTVAALLPLPEQYRDASRWIEGSADATAVVAWFHTHRDRLRWDSKAEHFVLE